MKKRNIIWFLVDSVRNYHTDLDERGRLDIMDEVAKEAIDFRTAITSAPSTVMSVSSMMTGVGAMYQSRDYYGFKYNKNQLPSLPQVLRKQGYNIYSLIFFPEGRRFLKSMFHNICEENWKGKYGDNEFWSNDQMNEILEDILTVKLPEPFFLYVHYNCRHDPETNQKINKGINTIKKNKYFDDSIFILNSDHGYPDASRNISFYEKRKYGHDLIMTDDNILAPQIIKLPGVKPRVIESPISTLDITPTILDYLGLQEYLNLSSFNISGRSRMPQILGQKNNESEIVRVDNRFIFQNDKVVALRDSKHKYIYYYETKKDEFFDLMKDPEEENNIIDIERSNKQVIKFRNKLKEQENELIKFHVDELRDKLIQYKLKSDVIVIGQVNKEFELIFDKLFLGEGFKKTNKTEYSNINSVLNKRLNKIAIESLIYYCKENRSGVTAFFFPISSDPITNYRIKKCYNLLGTKYISDRFVVDSNLDITDLPKHWIKIFFTKLRKRISMLRTEPKTLIYDLFIHSKRIISKS